MPFTNGFTRFTVKKRPAGRASHRTCEGSDIAHVKGACAGLSGEICLFYGSASTPKHEAIATTL